MSPLSRRQLLTFAALWVTYCVVYFLRKPLGIVKPELGSLLQLTKSQLGWLDLALLLPYAAVQIAFSTSLDRIPPRILIATCLSLASLAMLLFCGTYHFMFALFCLFLSGAFQAPIWPALTKVGLTQRRKDK